MKRGDSSGNRRTNSSTGRTKSPSKPRKARQKSNNGEKKVYYCDICADTYWKNEMMLDFANNRVKHTLQIVELIKEGKKLDQEEAEEQKKYNEDTENGSTMFGGPNPTLLCQLKTCGRKRCTFISRQLNLRDSIVCLCRIFF